MQYDRWNHLVVELWEKKRKSRKIGPRRGLGWESLRVEKKLSLGQNTLPWRWNSNNRFSSVLLRGFMPRYCFLTPECRDLMWILQATFEKAISWIWCRRRRDSSLLLRSNMVMHICASQWYAALLNIPLLCRVMISKTKIKENQPLRKESEKENVGEKSSISN